MNAAPSWWRRLAIKLAQHASRVLPAAQARGPRRCGTSSTISRTMRPPCAGRSDASWRATGQGWPKLRCFSARASLRYVGMLGVLLLVVGVALEGHASGQTEPLKPVFDETALRSARCIAGDPSAPSLRHSQRPAELRQPRRRPVQAGGRRREERAAAGTSRARGLCERRSGSPLTVFADHKARTPYAPSRDLILVDQREPADRSRSSARTSTARSSMPPSPSPRTRATMHQPSVGPSMRRDDAAPRRPRTALIRGDFTAPASQSPILSGCGGRLQDRALERLHGRSYGTTVAMTLWSRCIPGTVRAVCSIRSIRRTRDPCSRPT